MTSPRPDLRVGLVGYGLAGSAFHAPFIAATPGLRLAAVVTRDPGRQAQARRDHPGPAWWTTWTPSGRRPSRSISW